jgi:hypothetical protein
MEDDDNNNDNSATFVSRSSTGLSAEASRLFRVYRTIANMLEKRGYMVPRDLRELTPTKFINRFGEYPNRESLTMLVVCSVLCVYKQQQPKFVLVVGRNVVEILFDPHLHHFTSFIFAGKG